jgi:hypothetical protein
MKSPWPKTEGLEGQAFLRMIAETEVEGEAEPRALVLAAAGGVGGDSGWTYSKVRCYLPPETTGVWLDSGLSGKGRAWFDDISLVVQEREDLVVSGENLLVNPSFEEGTSHWYLFSDYPGPGLEYGTLPVGQDGGPALYLRQDGETATEARLSGLYQNVCGLYGHGGTLRVDGSLRGEMAGGKGWIDIVVFGPSSTDSWLVSGEINGETPWQEFTEEISIDDRIGGVWLVINLEGEGALYVEQLELVFQESSAP